MNQDKEKEIDFQLWRRKIESETIRDLSLPPLAPGMPLPEEFNPEKEQRFKEWLEKIYFKI